MRTFGVGHFGFAHEFGQFPVPSGPMRGTIPFHDGRQFEKSQLAQYQQLADGE